MEGIGYFVVEFPTRNSENAILFGLPSEGDNQIISNSCILHVKSVWCYGLYDFIYINSNINSTCFNFGIPIPVMLCNNHHGIVSLPKHDAPDSRLDVAT